MKFQDEERVAKTFSSSIARSLPHSSPPPLTPFASVDTSKYPEVSVSYCFICLLHLANEKVLVTSSSPFPLLL